MQVNVVLVLTTSATLADLRVIARETTSRDARSLADGAYRSMKRSPSEFFRYPPSTTSFRQEASCTIQTVGWNWTTQILQGQAGAQRHTVAISSARVRRRRGEPGAP